MQIRCCFERVLQTSHMHNYQKKYYRNLITNLADNTRNLQCAPALFMSTPIVHMLSKSILYKNTDLAKSNEVNRIIGIIVLTEASLYMKN